MQGIARRMIVKTPNSIFSILQAVKSTGLLTSDPRLRDCMEKIREAVRESAGEVMMDRELFRKLVFDEVRQHRFTNPAHNEYLLYEKF